MTECRFLVGIFLNDLKDKVKVELKLHTFHMLDELMDLVKLVESRKKILHRGGHRSSIRLSFVPNTGGPMGVGNLVNIVSIARGKAYSSKEASPRGGIEKGKGYKQLSDEEYREKRSKGLCFACVNDNS